MKMVDTSLNSSNYYYTWRIIVALVQCNWEGTVEAYENVDNNISNMVFYIWFYCILDLL